MKIAVTATGKDINSRMDPRFGRAQYILILDEDGNLLEVVDNSVNANALKGAGIQAGKVLADKKVDVLITGHCGPNAFRTLEAGGTRVIVNQSGTVKEAVEQFKSNEVQYAEQPNVEAHW
jgi:predicted Fe-Mo cluster-binding NifX family protein